MSTIAVFGAGAIGRGYLPWVFDEADDDFIFVDSQPALVSALSARDSFLTFRAAETDRIVERRVRVARALLSDAVTPADLEAASAVFVCVGPRNVARVAPALQALTSPVVVCENDPATVDLLIRLTGRQNIRFAVPDVISSNSAPEGLRKRDPLALVTETGILHIAEGPVLPKGDYRLCSPAAMRREWTAKLFLHNTPHCIAAYLGAVAGVTYVHEAMQIPAVEVVVRGAMDEMLSALKAQWEIPHDFLDWYASKELSRFSNRLLCDPVGRVAREPLRKLDPRGRLLGAAQICLSHGCVPTNVLMGIAAALLFDSEGDADHHMAFMRRAIGPTAFLSHVLGLKEGDALEVVLRTQLDGLAERIGRIRGAHV